MARSARASPACRDRRARDVGHYLTGPARAAGPRWTSPVTNRLLLEAGLGTYLAKWGRTEHGGNPTRAGAREGAVPGAAARRTGASPNLTYRSANWGRTGRAHSWRGIGVLRDRRPEHEVRLSGGALSRERSEPRSNEHQPCSYRVNNGVPNQLTRTSTPSSRPHRVRYDAFYAQDQWTLGR